MKLSKLIFLISIVLVMTSCSLFSGKSTEIKLIFNVSSGTKALEKGGSDLPNEVIYMKVDAEEPTLEHVALESGENTITVPKGGVYLIGLVNTHSPEGIQLIGEVRVAEVGLDSIPVSEEAADEIYLGTLNLTDSGYESTISGQTLAEATGYSEDSLFSFGRFDDTVIKFLNPDINCNGQYDVDEGITWTLSVWYIFMDMPVPQENYDDNTVTIPLESFCWDNMNFDFWTTDALGYFNMDDAPYIKLVFPEDVEVITWGGTRLLEMAPGWVDTGHFSFDTAVHSIKEPVPPYNGNYQLVVYDDVYYLNDIYFLVPENNFDGFLFPIYRQNEDENGIITSVDFRWKILRNGQYEEASSEEVSLQIRSLWLNWGIRGEPNEGGIEVSDFCSGGTVETPALDTNTGYFVTLNYKDLGNNLYGWNQADN